MPWNELHVEQIREEFINEVLHEEMTFARLCRTYGVSRKTGYKWLARHEESGQEGLRDLSRAPHSNPYEVTQDVVELILAIRRKHPTWGPRKLLEVLQKTVAKTPWPVPSTIGRILKRNGLVIARRARRHATPYTRPFASCEESNDLWCADFKGWFKTRDGKRCDPLTISDAASRYLLRCQIVTRPDYDHAQPVFETTFREYGMPRAIRTDNGAPFASVGLGGLSKLSVWLLKHGVKVERIEPGNPQQNGRHERMHRTMKDDALKPPQANARQQQRALDQFRDEYNNERPHESLNMQCPADVYSLSPREFPERVADFEYPEHDFVRGIRTNGQMRWRGKKVFVSDTLKGEHIGLRWHTDSSLIISFGPVDIGLFDEREMRVKRLPKIEPPADAAQRTGGESDTHSSEKVLPMS
jgi:putative transposase